VIGLVAVLKTRPGMEQEAYDTCSQMAGEVNKKEKGCLLYEAYKTRENPSEIYILEKYSAMEDLEEHRQTTHYLEFREKIKGLLSEPPAVTILDPID